MCSEPDVPIEIEALDTDPWVLNVENGTIDLRTGELREHRKEDFITKLARVAFASAVTCPMWAEFLGTIFAGNADLIGYAACAQVGYSLTGVADENDIVLVAWDRCEREVQDGRDTLEDHGARLRDEGRSHSAHGEEGRIASDRPRGPVRQATRRLHGNRRGPTHG